MKLPSLDAIQAAVYTSEQYQKGWDQGFEAGWEEATLAIRRRLEEEDAAAILQAAILSPQDPTAQILLEIWDMVVAADTQRAALVNGG